ncbi:hypothetical protein D3C83_93460 [compost metagenome]
MYLSRVPWYFERMMPLISVRYSFMYSRSSSGLSISEIPVKPRTSENRMVSSACFGSMVYFSGSEAIRSTSSGGTYWPNSSVNWRLERDSTK